MNVSSTHGTLAAVQMALLARVLDTARPSPAPPAAPADAAMQAATSRALLESVATLDVLA